MSIKIGDVNVESGSKVKGFLKVGEASTHDIKIPFIAINGTQKGPILCTLGGVHPVEYTSIEALLRVAKDVEPSKLKGTLIVVPIVNTDGFHARASFNNPIDYKNQARAFPGDPVGTMSERVAYTLFEEIVSKVDYLIDCHSGDLIEDLDKILMIEKTDDERIHEKMVGMASCFDVAYVQIRAPRAHGARIIAGCAYVEAIKKFKIPAISVESGASYPVREENVKYHYEGLMNVMKYLGMLEGEPQTRKQVIDPPAAILRAERGGVWRQKIKAGEWVKKGTVIGVIANLFGDTLETITAPFDGILDHTRTYYEVNSGDWLAWVTKV